MNKMTCIKSFAKIYCAGAFMVGFHRGYCNHYSDYAFLQHRYNFAYITNKNLYKLSFDENELKQNGENSANESNIITDKIIYGICSGLYYINPAYHIFIIYATMKRMEKRLRKIPMDKYDWYF